MSEDHPLLFDEDFYEEEQIGSYFHRRRKPMNLRGRAKYHIKGASAIITKWPELWTTIAIYWWIGLGMIALTVFIIYNSLILYAMVPEAKLHKFGKPISDKINGNYPMKSNNAPNVFLHIFDDDEDFKLRKFLPYVDIIATEYKNFQFNVVVVTNDTLNNTNLNAENSNKVALTELWDDDFDKKMIPKENNTIIISTTIRSCFKDSPMEKYWDKIPKQLVKFLIRCSSIWESGGIAINPLVLTPMTPDYAYIEKVRNVLNNFNNSSSRTNKHTRIENIKKDFSPKFNNILDIINALERNEITDDLNEVTLSEAESVINPKKVITHLNREDDVDVSLNKTKYPELKKEDSKTQSEVSTETISNSDLLPLFIDYLFHKNISTDKGVNWSTEDPKNTSEGKMAINEEKHESHSITSTIDTYLVDTQNYEPVTVSATKSFDHTDKIFDDTNTNNDESSPFKLTLDLKGNILATEVSCHAFLGGIFTNSVYHTESESVTDFIIKELTVFCKGLLASCTGVDVILL